MQEVVCFGGAVAVPKGKGRSLGSGRIGVVGRVWAVAVGDNSVVVAGICGDDEIDFVGRCRYPVFGVPGLSGVGDGGVRCPMKGRSNKSSGAVVDLDPSYVPPSISSEEEHADGKRSGVALSGSPEESVKGCNATKSNKHMGERMAISAHPTRVAAAGALAAIRAQADASRRARNEVDSGCSAPSSSHDSVVAGSGAIILHPGLGSGDSVPGMALVPMRSKICRALDNGKRRVRRPFSVSEVEALVHAVEKLGTGRYMIAEVFGVLLVYGVVSDDAQ